MSESIRFLRSFSTVLIFLIVNMILVQSFMVSPYLKTCVNTNHNLNLISNHISQSNKPSYGQSLISQRNKLSLQDLLGLGPAEIGIVLILGLVLFGPETLKSLSKDMGKAAAELKEIPKTFKEGMEEGAQSTQVARMKMLAAEKRKKRNEKLGMTSDDEDDTEIEELDK